MGSQPDVDAAVNKRGIIVCSGECALTDVADLLIEADHTSVLVVDDSGNRLGVLTENDLMAVCATGADLKSKVKHWLRSGNARLPQDTVQMLTVDKATLLIEAARQMFLQRNSRQACHHLLVKTPAGDINWILSAMDIVKAIASQCTGLGTVARVADVMKTRVVLPECVRSAPLVQAVRTMFEANQNCVMVVDGDCENAEDKRIHDVITPRDFLHALAGRDIACATVADWLRGTIVTSLELRRISPHAMLLDAAKKMASTNMHHLVVIEPGSCEIQGVVSCLDVVCFLGQS
eukprot:TRINITY_DN89193_c0_g1_i1.p1 TRINITY_DN89193_c0_g1~~TRINITY_DN89193_c0_g1_i1.p1  ORF type:complete len:324 (+),score=53.87 TRINITY_DN89193_c0_g1_i1:101-973(+)